VSQMEPNQNGAKEFLEGKLNVSISQISASTPVLDQFQAARKSCLNVNQGESVMPRDLAKRRPTAMNVHG
jgi:hypothetical protein